MTPWQTWLAVIVFLVLVLWAAKCLQEFIEGGEDYLERNEQLRSRQFHHRHHHDDEDFDDVA